MGKRIRNYGKDNTKKLFRTFLSEENSRNKEKLTERGWVWTWMGLASPAGCAADTAAYRKADAWGRASPAECAEHEVPPTSTS